MICWSLSVWKLKFDIESFALHHSVMYSKATYCLFAGVFILYWVLLYVGWATFIDIGNTNFQPKQKERSYVETH